MPPFATCRDCGEQVRWAKGERGKMIRLTPLDVMPLVVDANNVARRVTTYDLHVCDEEKRVEHNERMADAQLRREQMEELLDRLWEAALKYPCEKCGAQINVRCRNLREQSKGNDVEVKWPHEGRVPEPIRIEIMETLSG